MVEAGKLLIVGAVMILIALVGGQEPQGIIGTTNLRDVARWNPLEKRIMIDYSHQNAVGIADCGVSNTVGFSFGNTGLYGVSEDDCLMIGGSYKPSKSLCLVPAVPPICMVDYGMSYSEVENHYGSLIQFGQGATFEGYCEGSGTDNFRYATYHYHIEMVCDPEELARLIEEAKQRGRDAREQRQQSEFPFQKEIDSYVIPDNAPRTYETITESPINLLFLVGAAIIIVGIFVMMGGKR